MTKAHGQIRRSQAVTSWGPGALMDLPLYSVIIGGLDTWPPISKLEAIDEPRLERKLSIMTGIPSPRLYAPPADTDVPGETKLGIGVWRFPEWFVVQEESKNDERERSRRLVNRKFLDARSRFEGRPVVPTRFVRACPRGHIDDLDWKRFVHDRERCVRQMWLDETGTSGDLADLRLRCECGKSRGMHEATVIELNPLGTCRGARPWLGPNAPEDCNQPSRLLIRTAANAYFSQVVSVLSLPDRVSAVDVVVADQWQKLQYVESASELGFVKKDPAVVNALLNFTDDEIVEAIRTRKSGDVTERPVKQVELDALVAAEEGFGDDVPIDDNFHARRLPESIWRNSARSSTIETVIQLHRLREVQALTGFTRFEAVTPNINGEYDSDVETADLALEPRWFPAVENRGEGIFIKLRSSAIQSWLNEEGVKRRVDHLAQGYARFMADRGDKSDRSFLGGPFVLLHTLSHLLIQALSMRSGYPASSIRERIYNDAAGGRYGILLYTGTADSEGTLGGLVQQARHIEAHLAAAFRIAALCSNDPICSQHDPIAAMESRWLHGASCHACTLIAETSCEMRNDYLDRALVVPTVSLRDAAFFGAHK